MRIWFVFASLTMATAIAGEAPPKAVTTFPTPTKGELARRIALFAPLNYVPTEHNEEDHTRYYRLFIPSAAKESVKTAVWIDKKYPLLVWLHGYGESGDDNWRHLMYIQDEVARWDDERGGFPAFVLALQSSYEDHWGSHERAVLMQVIKKTIEQCPIDLNRIYIAGVSSGGNTCWHLAAEQPDTFAALAPMSSSGVTGDAAALAKIPIWAFQVTKDPVTSPVPIRQAVGTIQSIGGPCWLTETAGKTHDCWTAAFNDYGVIGWLLSQRRNSPATAVPTWVIWKSFRSRYLTWEQLWPMLVLMVAVIGLVFVLRRELRRRQLEATDGFSSPQ